MLSKVIKGFGAGAAPAMIFAGAGNSPPDSRQQPASDRSAGAEDQRALIEKNRALESAISAAKQEAFEAGQVQGEQQARAALKPVLERLHASIAEVVNLRPEMRRLAEKDAVGLSLQIARRVLHRELSIDGNALNALARVVFDRLTRSESWQLTVHPQFADGIRSSLPAGSTDKIRIETDPSCAPGTFIVRSPEGKIDASVDSQLAEIERGLTDRLGG